MATVVSFALWVTDYHAGYMHQWFVEFGMLVDYGAGVTPSADYWSALVSTKIDAHSDDLPPESTWFLQTF